MDGTDGQIDRPCFALFEKNRIGLEIDALTIALERTGFYPDCASTSTLPPIHGTIDSMTVDPSLSNGPQPAEVSGHSLSGESDPGVTPQRDGVVELPPIPALVALGQLLSQARQAQGLDVPELARRLHMGQEQLASLEGGDRARLPEPVFVIAQARRIAACLGVAIDAEIEALRQSESFNSTRATLNPERFKRDRAKSDRARDDRVKADRVKADRVKADRDPPQGTPHQRDGKPGAQFLAQPQTQQVRSRRWGGPGPMPGFRWGRLAALALVAGLASALYGGFHRLPRWPVAALTPPARLPAAPLPVGKVPTQVGETSLLVLTTSQVSWLEVRRLQGGERLFMGTLKGERAFPLDRGLRVLAGRPDLVKARIGKGPAMPLGTISEIRWTIYPVAGPQSVKAGRQAPAR